MRTKVNQVLGFLSWPPLNSDSVSVEWNERTNHERSTAVVFYLVGNHKFHILDISEKVLFGRFTEKTMSKNPVFGSNLVCILKNLVSVSEAVSKFVISLKTKFLPPPYYY